MIKKLALIIFTTIIITNQVFAHSPLKSTSPANEAILNEAPQELKLTFAKPARVVKITMSYTNGDKSTEIKLDIPKKDFDNELQLTPEFMGNGDYLIKWRALSKDGHALKGDFSFTVNGG